MPAAFALRLLAAGLPLLAPSIGLAGPDFRDVFGAPVAERDVPKSGDLGRLTRREICLGDREANLVRYEAKMADNGMSALDADGMIFGMNAMFHHVYRDPGWQALCAGYDAAPARPTS